MTVARMHEEMDCVELVRWTHWFALRLKNEQKAARKARRSH